MGRRGILLLALLILPLASPLSPPNAQTANTPQPPTLVNDTAVGVCYPWLITQHTLLNLPSGVAAAPFGGDTILRVLCGEDTIIALGASATYVLDRGTGALLDTVLIGYHNFIGYSMDMIAFRAGGQVIVRTIGVGDIALQAQGSHYAFTAVNGTPVVVTATNTTLTATAPGEEATAQLPYPATALYTYNNMIYVATPVGVVGYRVEANPLRLDRDTGMDMYTPFTITSFARGTPSHLYAYTQAGLVVELNLEEKTWTMIGYATVTPAGFYTSNTTYIPVDGGYEAVPGYAVAVLGGAAITTLQGAGETRTVLYPLVKSVLVLTQPLNGTLQIPVSNTSYIIHVNLQPGAHLLPRGTAIITADTVIPVDAPEITYPQPPATPQPQPPTQSNVRYMVNYYPREYQPLQEYHGIKYVAVGAGKIIALNSTGALIISTYGLTAFIPGLWQWGGIGDNIVLYDGGGLRVYDYAGNPIASYSIAVNTQPYTAYTTGETVVLVSRYGVQTVINQTGITQTTAPPYKVDPTTGLLYSTTNNTITLGNKSYTLPEGVTPYITRYMASWAYQDAWYILNMTTMTAYVILDPPQQAIPLPLGDLLAVYNPSTRTLQIVPFTSWFLSQCYVDITAPPDAQIYVNNTLVGNGSLTYYAQCGETLTITAKQPYHQPDTKTVTVQPGGVQILLSPTPLKTNVTLLVKGTKGVPVEAAVVEIDGKTVTWRVGGQIQLIPGKPYNITVLSWQPYDVFTHPSLANIRFKQGQDTLTLNVNITGSILGLTSKVPVRVYISTANVTIMTVNVAPNASQYLPVDPGNYTLLVVPLVEGYTNHTLNVTIPPISVVEVDVTPLTEGVLTVIATPLNATIKVVREGKVVANGTGVLNATLKAGNYTIIVTAPGYKEHTEQVTIHAGETKQVTVILEQAKPPAPPPKPPFWKSRIVQVAALAGIAATAVIALLWRKKREEAATEVEV